MVFMATVWLTMRHFKNTILPDVYVQTVDVSGLTVDEAVTVLTRALPAPETLGVDVQVVGQTWPISWADAGRRYDIRATAQAAYNVGRDAAGKASLLAKMRAQNVVLSPVIAATAPDLVMAHITQIAVEVARTPVDAQFSLDGAIITSTPGQPGQYLDIEAGVSHVLQALVDGTPSVGLTLVSVAPDVAEPEPARTQAQAWLAEPFTLIVDDASTEVPPENNVPGEAKIEFTAPPERISTWLEPQIEDQGITLHVADAPVRAWLEEIALQLGHKQPLDIDPTLQNVLTALKAGQHRAEASVGPPDQFYTVQIGDTLLGIALEFGTTVNDLKAFNHLDSDLIVIGEVLLLPIGALPPETQTEVVSDTPPSVIESATDMNVPDVTPHSAEWREDLAALAAELKKLPEIHKEGFSVVHDEVFTQAVAALDTRIPGLADHQIVVGIMQILALLGDAHTGVNWYKWGAFQEHAYPIELQWFQDGLFVTAAQPGYEDLLTLELVQIGGVPIEQVMGALARIIPHENTYRLRAASTNYIIRPVILHALGLTADLESAAFVFQSVGSDTVTRYLIADSPTAMQDRWIRAVPRDAGPLYLQKLLDTYYWYTYLESGRSLYFQFNRCAEQPETPFVEFLDAISHVIATQSVEKYIIDLRRNPGGSPGPPGLILDHLQTHPQFAQQKRLFVLTGNQTFSSAVYLTSLLRQQANAILIGEPTAQGPNFYASPKAVILPNSGLTINLSYAYVQSAEDSSETIQPDILVTLSSWEYFAGQDPVLQTALSQP